ncbi:MAG: methionyl-tRNA formyltransferase [Bacteroidota bacterium]
MEIHTRLKNKLRIVFMGTPDFAVGSLKAILEAGFEVVGVITAPDRPAGRGRKLQESAVKSYAVEHGLKVMQPSNLKNEEFLEELRQLKANLQVVVAFRMLPKVVWSMPIHGTFNLHASLLPQYRGAAPINWAIINGETETGVTTFFIDDKIDTGHIILQKSEPIYLEDNAGTLHDRLMLRGAGLVVETCQQIASDQVTSIPQKDATAIKSAHKINRETCKIDWTASMEQIHNHIRGLSPYPAAWCQLINNKEEANIKIYKSRIELAKHTYMVGKLFPEKKGLKVAVAGGYLHLLEVQLPGKRRMEIGEVLNGLSLDNEAHLR